MAELTIYDSEGRAYDPDGTSSQTNETIEDYFFAGVRVAIELGGTPTITVFFRARESIGGRSEQFYAVYKDSSVRNLVNRFDQTVTQRVEEEYNMSIDPSESDMTVFNNLTGTHPPVPTSDFEQELISDLLAQGQRLRFGVNDYNTALGVFKKSVEERDATSAAIADDAKKSALSEFDLVIEKGNYAGLKPLGDTSRLMDEARSSRETQLLNQKLSSIKSDVRDIRNQTSLSDSQIRTRLQREVPILTEQPRNKGSRGSGPANGSSGGSLLGSTAVAGLVLIGGGLALVLMVAYVYSFTVAPIGLLPGVSADGGGTGGDEYPVGEVISDTSIDGGDVRVVINQTGVSEYIKNQEQNTSEPVSVIVEIKGNSISSKSEAIEIPGDPPSSEREVTFSVEGGVDGDFNATVKWEGTTLDRRQFSGTEDGGMSTTPTPTPTPTTNQTTTTSVTQPPTTTTNQTTTTNVTQSPTPTTNQTTGINTEQPRIIEKIGSIVVASVG